MKNLSLALLVVSGAALAVKPAPPVSERCSMTAGLEIGMSRKDAFENMRHRVKDLKTANVKSYRHAPEGRGYVVDLTFASEAPDAKVTRLAYVYDPPAGVFDALRDRFGEPAKTATPGTWLFKSERCHVSVLYHAREDDQHHFLAEEATLEPLAK